MTVFGFDICPLGVVPGGTCGCDGRGSVVGCWVGGCAGCCGGGVACGVCALAIMVKAATRIKIYKTLIIILAA